jgi:hypothetical protein
MFKNLFPNVRRMGWIVLNIIFLLIPAGFALFLFHYGIFTSDILPCAQQTVWNFLWTCMFGTYAMMFVSGSFIVAIIIEIFFIVKIKNSKW